MQNLLTTFGHALQTCGYSIQTLISDRSTFNSTFHSNIRLGNWDMQYEYSMETFNLNIQHSIRDSIQKFDYSIPKFKTNLQSKHSIRTFTSNIQFEFSIRTFTVRTCNPNIQFEHSIRICNTNIQSEHSILTFNSNIQSKHSIEWFPGSSDQHPGRSVLERRERKESDPEVARVAYEIFQRFQ